MKSSIRFYLAWTSFQLEFVSIFHLFLSFFSLFFSSKDSKKDFCKSPTLIMLEPRSSKFLIHNSPFYLFKGLIGIRVFFFQINLKNNVLSFLIISAGATSACIAKIICGSRRDFTIQILPIMLQFLFDQVTMVRCMFSIRGSQLLSISDAGIELLK